MSSYIKFWVIQNCYISSLFLERLEELQIEWGRGENAIDWDTKSSYLPFIQPPSILTPHHSFSHKFNSSFLERLGHNRKKGGEDTIGWDTRSSYFLLIQPPSILTLLHSLSHQFDSLFLERLGELQKEGGRYNRLKYQNYSLPFIQPASIFTHLHSFFSPV